jgi:hypothetical protein
MVPVTLLVSTIRSQGRPEGIETRFRQRTGRDDAWCVDGEHAFHGPRNAANIGLGLGIRRFASLPPTFRKCRRMFCGSATSEKNRGIERNERWQTRLRLPNPTKVASGRSTNS